MGGMERGTGIVAAVLKVGKTKRNKNEERKVCEFAKECEGARNRDTRVGGKYKGGKTTKKKKGVWNYYQNVGEKIKRRHQSKMKKGM